MGPIIASRGENGPGAGYLARGALAVALACGLGAPPVVRYWSEAPDRLSAEISGRMGERLESIAFTYQRVACP